jgi:hypothetical protein
MEENGFLTMEWGVQWRKERSVEGRVGKVDWFLGATGYIVCVA